MPLETKDFPYNLKNTKDKSIYEENSHDTNYFSLNMIDKQRYHTIYQTSTIDQKQNPTTNYRNEPNNCQGGHKGCSRFNNNGSKI